MKNKKLKTLGLLGLTLGTFVFMNINLNAVDKVSSRYEGQNRYLTAIEVAKQVKNDKLSNIVISCGFDFPDALSGSVLASKVNAPILLVNSSVNGSMDTINFIKNNVDRNGTIYLLGGEGVVKPEIVQELKKNGFNNFKRLGGLNRYETNILINDELNVPKGTPVAIASGLNFPDALSISGAAGSNQMPIYLVNNSISQETLNRIKSIAPSTIYIAGGSDVVSSDTENKLRGISNNVVRFDGSDRYETSIKIANYFTKNTDTALVANALDFPDALSGSVLASKKNAPVILVPAKGNVSKQKEFIDKFGINNIIAVGGEDVVSKQVVNDLLYVKSETQKSLTPKEIETKLTGLGLSLAESGYGQKNYKSNSGNFVVSILDNNKRISITLYSNTTNDGEIVKTILNLALPTSGNEIYNILNGSFNTQNITRDGKNLSLYKDSYSVTVDINY